VRVQTPEPAQWSKEVLDRPAILRYKLLCMAKLELELIWQERRQAAGDRKMNLL